MTLFAPMWWAFWVVGIFSAFDFADAEDFAPLLSLAIGLASAACIFLRPSDHRGPASPALMATALLLSAWPLLPSYALFFLAREFQSVRGVWPQAMVHTPGQSEVSARFDNLFSLVSYFEAFAGAWMVIFLALIVQQKAFSERQRRFVTGACVASMIAFVLNFGGLYAWWLD